MTWWKFAARSIEAEFIRRLRRFRAGRASFGNVALIARLAGDMGAEATCTVEDTLVGAAEKLDVGRMGRLVAGGDPHRAGPARQRLSLPRL